MTGVEIRWTPVYGYPRKLVFEKDDDAWVRTEFEWYHITDDWREVGFERLETAPHVTEGGDDDE